MAFRDEVIEVLDGDAPGSPFGTMATEYAFGTALEARFAAIEADVTALETDVGALETTGGVDTVNTAASTTVTNTVSETDFSVTRAIAAGTIKAGTIVRIRLGVRYPSTNSTDTFLVKLYVGSQVVWQTTAVDLANDDSTSALVTLVGRAAAAASAAVEYNGFGVHKTSAAASCNVANMATNGALTVKASVTMSVASASNQAILEHLDVDVVGV